MYKRFMFVFFGLLAALLTFLIYSRSFSSVQQIDSRVKDVRFHIRGEVKPARDVVVVAIDHKSVKALGRWPWSREITADLITRLSGHYGVKTVALDMVFSEQQNIVADKVLADSIAGAGNVVLGYFFRNEESRFAIESIATLEKSRLKLIKNSEYMPTIPLIVFPHLDISLPPVGRSGVDSGFFNLKYDPDGLYRRSIMLMRYRDSIFPSLAISALQHYLDSEILLELKPWGVESLTVGGLKIPSREDGTMALNYYGRGGSFTTVSAVDVIAGGVDRELLAGKLALVGATEVAIYDLRPTPFDATFPGVEIHATVIANALEKRQLIYDSHTQLLEIAAMALFPIALGVVLTFAPSTYAGLGIMCATAALFFALNYGMFLLVFRDMTLIYPLAGILVTSLLGEGWRYAVVDRKRRQLKRAFSSYISPELGREIEKNPEKLVLGGEQREITILFADIRGFTAFSESLSPPELVKLLNEYLSPMTHIVMSEHGTLDKFVGDAIMALFNAPLNVPDHGTRACKAAAAMLAELARLNTVFATRGIRPLEIGIGINTGLAIVGNMGADIRFDYTAIGDPVNLASRVEGLNKQYGTHILVSEETRSQVMDMQLTFREVDRVRVKGKINPTVIYELMTASFELLPAFERGLDLFRAKEFTEAKTVFEELVEKYNDGPSRLYLERCTGYINSPPPEEWDWVHIAISK